MIQAPEVSKSKVLIVQNKGGGHGEIGYQLCKTLQSTHAGVDITVLQDEACDYKKPPFSKYESDLLSKGVKVINTPLTGDGAGPAAFDPVKGMQFDYIVDNWSKGADNANCVIDVAKSSGTAQHIFISSAGMYKTEGTDAPGATESSEVKENDARKVEMAVAGAAIPYTFLRPQVDLNLSSHSHYYSITLNHIVSILLQHLFLFQLVFQYNLLCPTNTISFQYIYGPNANKRYLDYFIARAARKLPIPVPLDGEQKVAVTHIEDISSLIISTMGKDAAMNEIFNCGTDNYISYNDLCKGIHKALGNADSDCKITYYEPKDYSDVKFDFPFRRGTFVTDVSKIQDKCGWKSARNVANDLAAECAIYEENGGMKKELNTEKDALIK